MTVQEIHKFLEDNPEIESTLRELIAKSIATRKSGLLNKDNEQFITKIGITPFIEVIPGDQFRLNYHSTVVNEVLLRSAIRLLQTDLPITIVDSLKFVNKFCEEIRKPVVRTNWYEHLEAGLEGYVLVYLNHIHGVDVTAFLYTISQEDRDKEIVFRVYEHNYIESFPYLNDSVQKCFETIEYFYSSPDQIHTAIRCLDEMGLRNPEKALHLYEYAKNRSAERFEQCLSILLIQLHSTNMDFCFKEAVELHEKNPLQGLHAISFFKYTGNTEIEVAFNFIDINKQDHVNYKRDLIGFYSRLIENTASSSEVRSNCFILLKELFQTDDEQLKFSIIHRVSIIQGFDNEKYELLPDFFSYNVKFTLNNFFDYFDSPTHLFSLIKDAYLSHGMNVDLSLFNHAISTQFLNHAVACEQELLNFFADELPIVRYAGSQILTSNSYGTYNVDFLKLNKNGQEKIIETILIHPFGIEELLPLILNLRYSKYSEVVLLLNNKLIELIWAYSHHLLELVKPLVNLEKPEDKLLLEKLEEGQKKDIEEKTLRNSVGEFDPRQNENESMRLFFRLESEQNAGLMERASEGSFFTHIARNITVIRGSAFKSEASSQITKLETISMSRLVDQRYYVDPEYYEWTFRLNAYGKKI